MRSTLIPFGALTVVATLLLGVCTSSAFQLGVTDVELRPYLKGGSLGWDQLKGVGGIKSLIAVGLNTDVRTGAVGATLSVEKWWLAEKLDDDAGIIPRDGYSLALDGKYIFRASPVDIYPIAGLGYDKWAHRGAPSWDSLKFMTGRLGAGLGHEQGYVSAAFLFPFAVNAQGGPDPKARLGGNFEGGIRIKAFTLGLFFKTLGFQDADTKMVQSGVFLAYSFR